MHIVEYKANMNNMNNKEFINKKKHIYLTFILGLRTPNFKF